MDDSASDTPTKSFDDFVSPGRPVPRRAATTAPGRSEWWQQTQSFIGSIYYPIVFGLFAVFPALQASGVANDQSQVANQLALLSLCAGNFTSAVCTQLLRDPDVYLWDIADSVFDLSPSVDSRQPGQPSAVSGRTSRFGRDHVFMPSYAAAGIVSYVFCMTVYECLRLLRNRQPVPS